MIIAIEGNIGAGKSTFIKWLHAYITCSIGLSTIILEPVTKWVNDQGDSLLELYYQGAPDSAFNLQKKIIEVFNSIYEKQIHKRTILILERSWFASIQVFAQHMVAHGRISFVQFETLQHMVCNMATKINFRIDRILYLRVNTSICQDRIAQRQQLGDAEINYQYLAEINQLYDQWLLFENRPQLLHHRINIQVIDWNSGTNFMDPTIIKLLADIEFVAKTQEVISAFNQQLISNLSRNSSYSSREEYRVQHTVLIQDMKTKFRDYYFMEQKLHDLSHRAVAWWKGDPFDPPSKHRNGVTDQQLQQFEQLMEYVKGLPQEEVELPLIDDPVPRSLTDMATDLMYQRDQEESTTDNIGTTCTWCDNKLTRRSQWQVCSKVCLMKSMDYWLENNDNAVLEDIYPGP